MNKIIEILKSKRVKSFIWRTSMMAIAGLISIIASNLGILELSTQTTIIFGLILGEISKALNNMLRDNTYL